MRRVFTKVWCQRAIAISSVLMTGCSVFSQPFLNTKKSPLPPPQPTASPSTPRAVRPTPTPTIPGDPFEKGLDRAASATTLGQAAQTQDDWNLVISRWQQAIAFMKAVPTSSPDRGAAQKLLVEYQQSLNRAQQRAKSPGQSSTAVRRTQDEGIPLIAGSNSSSDLESSPDVVATLNRLNQQQIQFFTKQKRFATNLKELNVTGIDTATYTYSTAAIQPTQAASTAIAKQDGPSYTGAVFIEQDEKGNPIPIAGICITAPATKTPPIPELVSQKITCPPGSKNI